MPKRFRSRGASGSVGPRRLRRPSGSGPQVDGPGVCREVRKRSDRPYVHIVLVTSRGSKQDIVAGLESGADDYLTKP